MKRIQYSHLQNGSSYMLVEVKLTESGARAASNEKDMQTSHLSDRMWLQDKKVPYLPSLMVVAWHFSSEPIG